MTENSSGRSARGAPVLAMPAARNLAVGPSETCENMLCCLSKDKTKKHLSFGCASIYDFPFYKLFNSIHRQNHLFQSFKFKAFFFNYNEIFYFNFSKKMKLHKKYFEALGHSSVCRLLA